jgi:hypothetical protein
MTRKRYRQKNNGHEIAFWGIRPRLDVCIAANVGYVDSGDNFWLVEQVEEIKVTI